MARFGKLTDSAASSISSADSKIANSATPDLSGVVLSLTARIWVDSGSTVVKGIIYSDTAGVADALLATSDEVTITNTTEAEITFAFSGANQINITSGTAYWIGIIWQDPGVPNINWSRGGVTSLGIKNSDTYSDGPANPFGTTSAISGPLDIYVTYTESYGSSIDPTAADIAAIIWAYATRTLVGGIPGTPANELDWISKAIWEYATRTLTSSVVNASITQVAATITATGGTQTVASVNIAAITQVAANVTATGGTQSVVTQIATSVTQVAANITASGGTQAVATVNIAAISQTAANVTATGGTQVIATVNNVAITQVAANVTATGGTQTVSATASGTVAISQVAANITASGGTQTITTVNNVSIAQTTATLTAAGGAQIVSTALNVSVTQLTGTLTATGGTQSITTFQQVGISQLAANLTASGGTQTVTLTTLTIGRFSLRYHIKRNRINVNKYSW